MTEEEYAQYLQEQSIAPQPISIDGE